MVAYYTIAGKQVGSHVLSMATLGAVFGISWLSMGGSSKKTQTTPPIQASSKDEENFIQYGSYTDP
ncbi:hypothetical protein H072_8866 [Dactylellina haptotyla CBS 200.50]|uniref:Uncharacterized protein n=1 Tax=Dactylellina haptotyla (strain CBS 200.50) TaxID=1284197 RepID=S8BQD0_DACHA|nr:hypothetical protein H072_8866 [Dactylellina haptotyla CBS 200.50]